jgi:hypothetical protein
MPTISSSVTVDKAAGPVFDFMVEPRNQVEWSPNFLSLDSAPSAPPALGTRFRGTIKNFGSMDLEYSKFERPREFEMSTRPRLGRTTHSFRFEPEGEQTVIRQTVGFAPSGAARLIAPLMTPLLRRMVSNLDRRIEATVAKRLP